VGSKFCIHPPNFTHNAWSAALLEAPLEPTIQSANTLRINRQRRSHPNGDFIFFSGTRIALFLPSSLPPRLVFSAKGLARSSLFIFIY
jgi:hypothetical protein